jgi:hypothetical protein
MSQLLVDVICKNLTHLEVFAKFVKFKLALAAHQTTSIVLNYSESCLM